MAGTAVAGEEGGAVKVVGAVRVVVGVSTLSVYHVGVTVVLGKEAREDI